MKISWNDLCQLVDLDNINTRDSINRLTLAGFEIESVEYIEKLQDIIIDLNITANRQDITGWVQVAIEISAIFERPLRIKSQPSNILLVPLHSIAHLDLLEAYICCINNIILLEKYQNYACKLSQLGHGNTGSILDIIDVINLKWGQSISVYGLTSKTASSMRSLTIHKSDETEEGLRLCIDGRVLPNVTKFNIHKLNKVCGILLINYRIKKRGNKNHYLSCGSTQHCVHAYSEIFSILKNKTQSKSQPLLIHQYIQSNTEKKHITATIAEINKVLGPTYAQDTKQFLDSSTIIKIIQGLNMTVNRMDNKLKIGIPVARRNDIQSIADIAEEVARIYGFNNFLDKIPRFEQKYLSSQQTNCKHKIRNTLRSMGIHEILNYSFQSQEEKNSQISIINPLNQGQEILRSNLISGIMETRIYNINQDNVNFEAFETGSVFTKQASNVEYQESTRLSCILGNTSFNQSNWQTNKVPLTWLQAKGQIEELFENINAQIFWSQEISSNHFAESLKPYVHPAKRIGISDNCQIIGILSKVNYLDSKLNHDNYFMEVDLGKLAKTIKHADHLAYKYSYYSNYPKITRDFSITISTKITMGEIKNTITYIRNNTDNIIESVKLLSEYYNSRDKKTVCLRATYRSKFKTLTSTEVKILDKILKTKLSIYTEARHKPGSVLNN